jgi:hypothetical protein
MNLRNRTSRTGELKQYIQDKFTELDAKQPQVNPPLELFHYSAPEGLIGIVQTTKLWATNIRYLNDFSEVKYTYDLLREMVSLISSKKSRPLKTFLEQFQKELSFHEMIFDAYVFCLSETGDQLSQWREYANRGIGYSVGFKGAGLKRLFGHRIGMKLLKVIYERHEQMKLIERIIIDSCNVFEDIERRYKDRTEKNILDCCDLLMAALTPYTVQFKHHVFYEEREWRIVFIPFHDINEHIVFRYSGKLIVPYIIFGLPEKEKLPINSVYQGPQADFDLTRKSLQILFSQNNYSDISIRESEVPIRF